MKLVPCNLTDAEDTAFLRFCETCEDGEGYDVAKDMMLRLAHIGLVHGTRSAYFETTELGNSYRAALAATEHVGDGGGKDKWNDSTLAEWGHCQTRGPWIINNLKARIADMRNTERNLRKAFTKDFMGLPSAFLADAYRDAANALDARLSAIRSAMANLPPSPDVGKEGK